MRISSRKKKEQSNSQGKVSPQMQSRPFEEQTSADKETPVFSNEADLQRSPLKFAEIDVFASSRPSTPIVQPKLTIGQPNDRWEREADATADTVVNRLNSPQERSSQTSSSPKAAFFNTVQRDSSGAGTATPQLESSISQARGRGEPLTQNIKQPMEQAFNADFSGVKVHTDAQSDQMNQSIQAKAFTTGQDIFFKQGAYAPDSRSGQTLIAHELTHVVQQNGSGIQRKGIIQRNGGNDSDQSQEQEHQYAPARKRAAQLATIIVGEKKTDNNSIKKIRELLLAGDLEIVLPLFHDKTANQKTLSQAITETFKGKDFIQQYLLKLAKGESQTLIPQLLVASGLVDLGRGTDPEQMVTLIEYASPAELQELRTIDKGHLKDKVLEKLTKAGRHKDKKNYIQAIIEEKSDEKDKTEASSTPTKVIKDRELRALFNIIRGTVKNWRIHKKATTPEAEQRIMKWAARQTPEIRKYVIENNGILDRCFDKHLSNKGYQQYIKELIALNYGKYQSDEYKTAEERRDRVDALVTEQKPLALVSYLFNKKQHFSHGISKTSKKNKTKSMSFGGGGVLGNWNGLATRIEALDGEGRLIFLREFWKKVNPEEPFERQQALKELWKKLTDLGAKETKEPFDRIVNAFKAEATAKSADRASTPNLLRILVERNKISRKIQFTSRDAVELVSQLQPTEYLEVINNTKLLQQLKEIVKEAEWKRISNILGLEQWETKNREKKDKNSSVIAFDENNLESAEKARAVAADVAESRAEHWAAKLSHELEKGIAVNLNKDSEADSKPGNTAILGYDRNRVFSLVDQTVAAGNREAESGGKSAQEAKDFTQEVLDLLSEKAKEIIFDNPQRLGSAKVALCNGQYIPVRERLEGGTFRKGSLLKRWFRGRGMRQSSLLNMITEAHGEQLLEWSNIEKLEGELKNKESQISELDINPEFYKDIKSELPASEFSEVYSSIIYKLANALSNDKVVRIKIAEIHDKNPKKLHQLQDPEIAGELLRYKALSQAEKLNDSGAQYSWFSSKGGQRHEAMANLQGNVSSVKEKLNKGQSVEPGDVKELTRARKEAEGKKERFMQMRETAKKTTLRCVGLILAAACTIATGGLASAGLTGIGVSLILSAARAVVLEGVSSLLDLRFDNPYESFIFNVIQDCALAATTVGAGALSVYIENNHWTFANLADSNFTETLARNAGNISPIEAALRTATDRTLEVATSTEPDDYQKKADLFYSTLITAVKDSLSKTTYDMFKLGYSSVGDDFGKSILEGHADKKNKDKLALWIFAEIFTGQNVAVCEMDTIQDFHLNALSDKLSDKINKSLVSQSVTKPEESDDGAAQLKSRRGNKNLKKKKQDASNIVDNDNRQEEVRNANIPDWLNLNTSVEKVKFLKQELGASAYQCLIRGFTPMNLFESGYTVGDITKAGEKIPKKIKDNNNEQLRKQLTELESREP